MQYAISDNRDLLWISLWKLYPNLVDSSTLNTDCTYVLCLGSGEAGVVRLRLQKAGLYCMRLAWHPGKQWQCSGGAVRPQYRLPPTASPSVDTLCPSSQHHAAAARRRTWHVTTRGDTRPHRDIVNTWCTKCVTAEICDKSWKWTKQCIHRRHFQVI